MAKNGSSVSGVLISIELKHHGYKPNFSLGKCLWQNGIRCLNRGNNNTPAYMSSVQPGSPMQLSTPPYLPPAEAPNPILTDSNLAEAPFPPVKLAPYSTPVGSTASSPTPPNGQPKFAACIFLYSLVTILANLLPL